MKRTNRPARWLALMMLGVGGAGCELVAVPDRSLIPENTTVDAGQSDTGQTSAPVGEDETGDAGGAGGTAAAGGAGGASAAGGAGGAGGSAGAGGTGGTGGAGN